ncbi:MAG: hypothetical protein J6B16_02610 [Clostridia bacterium]|nr:hypothetical protein [Clostridia bacterium]
MKVCFATKSNFYDFCDSSLSLAGNSKVLVFGANGLGLISYKSELCGETEYFQDVAKTSKNFGGVVIIGCDTDTYGAFRKSAIVADSGKLLGVSDAVAVPSYSEYVGGANYVVYKTSAGKIGVLIGKDLYSVEAVSTMSLSDADVIFCIFDRVDSFMPEILLRAYSFIFGVPMVLVGNGYLSVTDIDGKIKISTPKNVATVDINTDKVYGEVLLKKRGYTHYKK